MKRKVPGQERDDATPGGYPVPAAATEVVDVVRRSRFHTTVARASSREDALGCVAHIRLRHAGATHHCWAFNAGAPGSTTQIGMSDDGEPHGTAGRPMLRVLLSSGLGEVVAVCARYYGGVKLGTGGLARAYRGGTRHALDRCPTTTRVDTTPILITVPWDATERVERLLPELGLTLLGRSFADGVCYHTLAPTENIAALRKTLADATAGRARIATETG